MNKLSIAIMVSLFFMIQCKKIKEKELNDSEWRKESIEIAQAICTKLESCVTDEFSKVKKSLQNYAVSELKSEKCAEKNKKSNVYSLRGNDPDYIKQVTRDCNSQIQKFSCDEIKSGSIKLDSSCKKIALNSRID